MSVHLKGVYPEEFELEVSEARLTGRKCHILLSSAIFRPKDASYALFLPLSQASQRAGHCSGCVCDSDCEREGHGPAEGRVDG